MNSLKQVANGLREDVITSFSEGAGRWHNRDFRGTSIRSRIDPRADHHVISITLRAKNSGVRVTPLRQGLWDALRENRMRFAPGLNLAGFCFNYTLDPSSGDRDRVFARATIRVYLKKVA